MKNKLLALFIALIASINVIWSSDTEVDGIYYNFNYGTKTAEVTWGGQYYSSIAVEYKGNIVIPSTVVYYGVTYTVTSVGEFAFRDCVSLLSLSLPEGITSIGSSAFNNCTLLSSINIPSSVTSIGGAAFSECRSLTSIIIPNGVKKIEMSTFGYCTNLEDITLSNNLETIGSQAFISCTKLRTIHLPERLITIGTQAFMSCTGLTSVTIPSSVSSIYSAFHYCGSLNTIIFDAQLPPYIDDAVSLFNGCPISSIYVPCGSVGYYKTNFGKTNGAYVKNQPSFKLQKKVKNGRIEESSHSTICDSIVTLTVTPDYGYHFVQWSDGIINNPRTIVLTQDTTMEAIMDKDMYTITTSSSNESWGNASGDTTALYLDTIKITATPNYGYQFVRWDDNETSNPRSVVVTQNKTYQAIFDKKLFTIEAYAINGMVSNPMQAYYLDSVKLTAIPYYGFHFKQWSDGVKEYSRVIVLTQDTTFTAEFAKNIYNISKIADNTHGAISGPSQAEYMDTITLTANSNVGYHFTQWSDGVTDNPRSFILTKDTCLTALFAINLYTITWKNNDGSTIDQTIVEHGNTPTHSEPTKTATAQYTYTFAGWSPEVVSVNGNAIYSATFDSIVNKYAITFRNGEQELQNTEIEYGQVPAYNGATPTKTATTQYTYIFSGWSPEVVAVTTDATYTATFDSIVNKYIITFKNGEQELQSTEVEYGHIPDYIGSTPVKPSTVQYSYTFTGWSPEVVDVTGNTTYTATFDSIVNKYTIVFKNGEQELQSTEVEYGHIPDYIGTTPVKPATAQYTYIFASWTPEVVAVTGDATYTATFDSIVNKYIVTFKNEEQELQSTDVEYGQVPAYNGVTPTKQATAQYTYTFAGWAPEIVSVSGDATYLATFDSIVNKYTVAFKNGEQELQRTEVEYGQIPAYNGATPIKQATAQYTYTFAGWTPEIVSVSGDATYLATFDSIVNKYTITFKNGEQKLQSTEIEYGQVPVYNGTTPTKEADAQYTYTFVEWSPEIVAVTEDATYTAIFTATKNRYIVTFLNEDSTVLQQIECEYGSMPSYTGEIPTKDSDAQYTYTFAGWNNEVDVVEGNTTYIATFWATLRNYLITFLDEDGTELCAQEWLYGAMPSCEEPTKADDEQYTYTFAGWTPEVVAVVGEATYTASYTAKPIGEGIEAVEVNIPVQKIFRDGQILILRGDKVYTLQGQEVR